MEQITVAGHPEPIPASPVAARMLHERLEETREKRGADAADRHRRGRARPAPTYAASRRESPSKV